MKSKFRISVVLALALTLAVVVPAFAGGWAVITLDELPAGVIAGEPFTVGFMVLQHGRTPMTDLDPTILIESPAGEKSVVLAKPEGEPGHYAATLNFPTEGNWNWTIQAFTMEQKMPALSVTAPTVASANVPVMKADVAKESSTSPIIIVRWLALGIGLVGLIIAFLRKSRLAIVLTALCLTVGVGSFVTAPAVPAVEAESASPAKVVSDTSISQVELGQQLFVAKGCITCHMNAKVPNSSDYWTINMEGATNTNLTNFSASPEILRIRLKNPQDAKSDTQMPNLGLSDAEIEALIAFINSK